MITWWRLSKSGGFKYKARLTQLVLNEITFKKRKNDVVLGKHIDSK